MKTFTPVPRSRIGRELGPVLVLAIAALLVATAAVAQSPFALTNIGADVRSSSARVDGRGGWGLAESDTLIPSFHNLAGLPGLKKMAIVVSGYAEQVRSKDASTSRTTNRLRTPTLRAAAPFADGRLIFSAGFQGLRGTQYDVQRETVYLLPAPEDPLGADVPYEGHETFVREGTQFQVPLGLSWRATSRLSLAANLNLVGGVMRERVNVVFDEPVSTDGTQYFLTTAETLEDEISGQSATVSLLVAPLSRLSLGAAFTPAHDWDVTRRQEMQGIPGSADSEYSIRIPELWAVGAALALSDRWRLGAEYESQPFSKLSGRADWEAVMCDAWRLGIGLDRAEAFARRAGRRNLPLRVGYSLQKWPYRVDGEDILERRISAGTGFSFRDRSGHLDLALSHAWIGELGKNGSRDRVWRLTVSVAGLEKWW